jgi:hypothetical protein
MSLIWNSNKQRDSETKSRLPKPQKTAKPRDVRTDGTADPRSVPFLTVSGNGGARRKSLLGLLQESNSTFESSAWYPNSGTTATTIEAKREYNGY